jgi:predicted RNase H-like HicB family nuclease
MIQEYCQNAIARAEYKKLDDGTWFAEIPGFQGVWANGESIEACRQDLWSVLEEWLVMKIQDSDPLPCFNGLSLQVKEVAVA